VAYPLITTIVVMGTANHYFLDAAAGAAVMGVGLLLTPLVLRIADRCRAALGLAAAAGTAAGDRSGGVGGRRAEESVTSATTASRGSGAPVVSGECQTSPGERIPRQRITEPEPGAVPAEAGDGAAAAAR
jgi:hypothetical protein